MVKYSYTHTVWLFSVTLAVMLPLHRHCRQSLVKVLSKSCSGSICQVTISIEQLHSINYYSGRYYRMEMGEPQAVITENKPHMVILKPNEWFQLVLWRPLIMSTVPLNSTTVGSSDRAWLSDSNSNSNSTVGSSDGVCLVIVLVRYIWFKRYWSGIFSSALPSTVQYSSTVQVPCRISPSRASSNSIQTIILILINYCSTYCSCSTSWLCVNLTVRAIGLSIKYPVFIFNTVTII